MNIELPTLHEAMLCLPGKLVSSEYPDYGKYMWLCDEGDRVLTPVRMITNEPTGPEEFLWAYVIMDWMYKEEYPDEFKTP